MRAHELQYCLDEAYQKALRDIKTKILELRPTSDSSMYFGGRMDMCNELLSYIENLKNKPYAS